MKTYQELLATIETLEKRVGILEKQRRLKNSRTRGHQRKHISDESNVVEVPLPN